MPKALNLKDLRARRCHLVDADFALAEGPEFVPKGTIDRAVWVGIVGLPDDVTIRTTDFRRLDVERAYRVAQAWHDVMGSLPDGGPADIQAFSVYENLETHCLTLSQAGTELRGLPSAQQQTVCSWASFIKPMLHAVLTSSLS